MARALPLGSGGVFGVRELVTAFPGALPLWTSACTNEGLAPRSEGPGVFWSFEPFNPNSVSEPIESDVSTTLVLSWNARGLVMRVSIVWLLMWMSAGVCQAQLGGMLDRLNENMRDMERRRQEMNARSKELTDQMDRARAGLRGLGSNPAPGNLPRGSQRGVIESSSPWNDRGARITEGLRVTPGAITHSQGERFLVRGEDGTPLVARHHVTVGSTRILLMPDGRLQSFAESEVNPTEKPFEPLDMDALEAKLLADPKLAGFKAIRSRRFLYLYNTSELFIRSSRTILESMYPAVRKYFSRSDVEIHEPELPLVVIAFANERQFQDYRRMPRGVVAYYDGLSNGVLLYEQSDLAKHAPEIAVKTAISTIAHEGAHQILHNIGVQQRLSRWPLWLSEGLAEFYAPTSVSRGVKWSGLGSTNELRMYEIGKDWKARRTMDNASVLKRVVSAEQLDSIDYAYAWGLTHMMSRRHREELFACIRHCSELGPLEGTPLDASAKSDPATVFVKHMGDRYSATSAELTKHLQSLNYVDPIANQTHYVVVSGRSVYLTSSPEKVMEWRRSAIGRFQVREYPNRAMAEKAMASIAR